MQDFHVDSLDKLKLEKLVEAKEINYDPDEDGF